MPKSNTKQPLKSQKRKSVDHSKTASTKSKALKIGLFVFFGLLFILFLGFISGVNHWTVKYVQCGEAPVVIARHIASTEYERLYPGDKTYGPDLFNSYECMSPAEKAGKRY